MSNSELAGTILKLERGEELTQEAIWEIGRLLDLLQDVGWSGFIPADEALAMLIAKDDRISPETLDEIKAALEGDSNDAEHDALVSVAGDLGIDWTSYDEKEDDDEA